MLEHDGKTYSQTMSILRYLGNLHGYYPTNAEDAYKVDSFIDGLVDFMMAFVKAKNETDEEKKKELMKQVMTETLPKYLAVFESRLKSNTSQHYLVGDKLTIADFAFAGFIFNAFYNDASEVAPLLRSIFEKFETLKGYAEHLQNEVLKEYLETRPKRPF